MKRICTVLTLVCIILALCAINVSAESVPVIVGGSFQAGNSVYVSESSFESSDDIMMDYLEYGASYQWCIDGAPVGSGSSLYLQESYGGKYVHVTVSIAGKHSGSSGAYYIEPFHSCVFPQVWMMDDNMHWRECTCGSVIDDESHFYSEDKDFCTTGHWFTCVTCGHLSPEYPHTMSDWQVVTDPTDHSEGLQIRSCMECGFYVEEVLPMLAHTHEFSVIYYDDAVSHWRKCECGERSNEGDHTYGPWLVTKEPTPTETGERSHVCSVCGLNMIEKIYYEEPAEEEDETEDTASSSKGKGKGEKGQTESTDTSGKGSGKGKNEPAASDDDTDAAEQESAATGKTDKPAKPQLNLSKDSTPWGLIIGIAGGVIVLATLLILVRKKRK